MRDLFDQKYIAELQAKITGQGDLYHFGLAVGDWRKAVSQLKDESSTVNRKNFAEAQKHYLIEAHRCGIFTWVSFEPVFNPEAVLRLINRTAAFVDFYKVGKINYHKLERQISWPAFRETVSSKLQELGKPFLIKKDLAEAK